MENGSPRKYSFSEFVAAREEGLEPDEKGYSFDNPNPSWIKHWNKHIPLWLTSDYPLIHHGDCTNVPMSCNLCVLELLLQEYHKYYFHEEQFRKDYDE